MNMRLEAVEQRAEHGGRCLADGDDSNMLQGIECDWLGSLDEEMDAPLFLLMFMALAKARSMLQSARDCRKML